MDDMGKDKNTMLAIVLIMIVTFLWMYLSPKTPAPIKKDLKTETQTEDVVSGEKKKEEGKIEKKEAIKEIKEVMRKEIPEAFSSIDQKLYTAVMSNYGASIKSLRLKNYRQDLSLDSGSVDVFDFENRTKYPLKWTFEIDKSIYKSDIPFEMISSGKNKVTFKGELIKESASPGSEAKGQHIADILVSYTFKGADYEIGYDVEIVNKTSNALPCSSTLEFFGKSNDIEGGGFGLFSAREEPVKAIYRLNDKIERESLEKQVSEDRNIAGSITWLGFNDKYFMTALIPEMPSVKILKYEDNRDKIEFFKGDDRQSEERIVSSDKNVVSLSSKMPATIQETSYSVNRDGKTLFEGTKPLLVEEASGCFSKKQNLILDTPKSLELIDDLFAAKLEFPNRQLKPLDSLKYSATIFAGPKEISVLKNAGKDMDRAIDLGDWIGVISRPLLYFLKWIYSLIPNYGIAIILLTLIVRLLMYPLTYVQNKSMKKMQLLKPEMDKLKAKFGSDKEALNREMMKLWKTHKVNPLGGCFPLLMQLPIFFALYRVLYNSIELRHTPFIFWIKDLSAYDPYFITPVLMGISFFLQQKMMPATTADPAQQKMMKIMMPLMFTFFMLFLPSGLVLYIFVSTLLGIAQQMFNMRSKEKTA